ncbi:Thioesterase/thiol ester dehydrase-isomerase [Trichoderma austrokoningii]
MQPRSLRIAGLSLRHQWPPISSKTAISSRQSSSSSPSSARPVNVQEMKSRPPKIIRDYLTPMPSHLLATTLSDLLHAPPPPASSTLMSAERHLPQGHHLVYFPLQTAASQLASDGADQDHAPNEEFTKRLWAGGEVRFNSKSSKGRLVLDGRAWVCEEAIRDVKVRGDNDDKVFVDLWRRYGIGHEVGEREWDVEERRTLVFMRKTENAVAARIIKYPHPATHSISLIPTPAHLFHFSALTFNAHSIHLDPDYARQQDGHKTILVHGPLTLALMLRVLNDHVAATSRGVVKSIVYRNYAPLYVGEKMTVCVRRVREQEWDVWVEGPEGAMAAKGSVVVE